MTNPTTLNSLIHDFLSCTLSIQIRSRDTFWINLTGHPINVETTNGVYVIDVAKDRYGQTWSLKVNQVATEKYCDADLGGAGKFAIHSRSENNGDLVLWCKETKEEVVVPIDGSYRFPSAFTGMTPIVSAMTGGCFASNTVLLPMTAPHENPTRNEKGWIVSVKGLRFN